MTLKYVQIITRMQNNEGKRSPELHQQVGARLRVGTGGGGEEGRKTDSSLIDIHKPSRSGLQSHL